MTCGLWGAVRRLALEGAKHLIAMYVGALVATSVLGLVSRPMLEARDWLLWPLILVLGAVMVAWHLVDALPPIPTSVVVAGAALWVAAGVWRWMGAVGRDLAWLQQKAQQQEEELRHIRELMQSDSRPAAGKGGER